MEALLDVGADVNWARWNGWTVLGLAAEKVAHTGPELIKVTIMRQRGGRGNCGV